MSPSSPKWWRRNDRIHGSVKPPTNPNHSQPHILNNNMLHDLYTLLSEAPDIYLDEIQDWIALAYKVGISKCSLFHNIHDAGATYKLLWKAAAERDEDAWQEWKDDVNAHFTAVQMVFVNETSKDHRTIYHHYGQRATIRANFVHGDRYRMVAALSLDGCEALCVVPGSVDGEEFLDFIIHDVVCAYVLH